MKNSERKGLTDKPPENLNISLIWIRSTALMNAQKVEERLL